ncbi:MAG: CarD family transcriptional regulator [Anaeromyxobacter sp.]
MRGPPPRHPDDNRDAMLPVEGVIADAAELKAGDRVVYPNQGVCAVEGMEEKDISGQKLLFVKMKREEDGATVMVPRNKVPTIGLRRVASGEQMEGVFHYLAATFDDPELDWKIRHRDNADRLIAGGVLGVAEVVKGLHALSRIRPLPTKEREQYDNARHLLVNEVAVSLGVPGGLAEDYIDYALMPPPGTKFDLKPPPKPVVLPPRQRRRPAAAAEEEGDGLDDLGLGELGIDLGGGDLDAALGAAGAEAGGEAAAGEGGEAAAEGEGGEAAEGESPAAEEAPPPKKGAKAPAKPAAKEKHAPEKHAPEKKPAAKRAPPKPEKKPAPKKAEKKPAAAKKPAAKKGKK